MKIRRRRVARIAAVCACVLVTWALLGAYTDPHPGLDRYEYRSHVPLAISELRPPISLKEHPLKQWTREEALDNTRQIQYSEYGEFIARISSTNDCNDVFDRFDLDDLFADDVKEKIVAFRQEVAEYDMREGHSGNVPVQTAMYLQLVRMPFVRTVCETGFNAGHSSLVWLAGNPNIQLYSFDIGRHPYSQPMADFLDSAFPGRLTVTWGDSTETLPKFYATHPDVWCDLVVIDGGHTTEIAGADMENFHKIANPYNVVVLDNYPEYRWGFNETLGAVWEDAKRFGKLREDFQCSFGPIQGLGFSVGTLVKLHPNPKYPGHVVRSGENEVRIPSRKLLQDRRTRREFSVIRSRNRKQLKRAENDEDCDCGTVT